MLAEETYFKALRNPEAFELWGMNRCAFFLLYVIAFRARRTFGLNRHGLSPGEAFIGDHQRCGMSEQEYRTAKQVLKKSNFATFRSTNKGTIATLVNTAVFDVNFESANGQLNRPATDSQRTANGRLTTNKNEECQNGKKENLLEAESIYALYPRKSGRPSALKAISKALKEFPAADLLRATEAFAAVWQGHDLTYCPYPAKWFNEERFNDDPTTWKRNTHPTTTHARITPDHASGF